MTFDAVSRRNSFCNFRKKIFESFILKVEFHMLYRYMRKKQYSFSSRQFVVQSSTDWEQQNTCSLDVLVAGTTLHSIPARVWVESSFLLLARSVIFWQLLTVLLREFLNIWSDSDEKCGMQRYVSSISGRTHESRPRSSSSSGSWIPFGSSSASCSSSSVRFWISTIAKIQNCTLNTTHSARNLGFIFDKYLTFSGQISALSKSCYSYIRELHCFRPSWFQNSQYGLAIPSLFATSIVHSKLDYTVAHYWKLLVGLDGGYLVVFPVYGKV